MRLLAPVWHRPLRPDLDGAPWRHEGLDFAVFVERAPFFDAWCVRAICRSLPSELRPVFITYVGNGGAVLGRGEAYELGLEALRSDITEWCDASIAVARRVEESRR